MPVPRYWPDILGAPAFLINLESRPDRLAASSVELRHAGFSDVRRFPAVDASTPGLLDRAWSRLGAPRFGAWDETWFRTKPGAQGCFLSHLAVWQEIIDQKVPFACVFEDDIFFHRHWANLAPTYFAFTPTDYDLLYLGSRIDAIAAGLVQRVPAHCMHAYVIPLEGAVRMRSVMLDDPEGVATIDGMIVRHQSRGYGSEGACPFNWYVWNGPAFPERRALQQPKGRLRDAGLVFQDFDMGTDIAT